MPRATSRANLIFIPGAASFSSSTMIQTITSSHQRNEIQKPVWTILGRDITRMAWEDSLQPDWAAKAAAVPYAEFADPQSLNLYSYVRNNPLSRVDPTGHATCANPPSCTKSTIDAHPAGEKGPTITFQNDDPNGKSPNQPVTTNTAVMVEKAVIKSGVKSVNINSTTGGKHAPTSNHPKGRAVDINKVNGTSVRSQGASPAVKSLQGAFAESPNIRESSEPAMMEKTSTPGSAAQPFGNSKLTEDHEGHIHESSQP